MTGRVLRPRARPHDAVSTGMGRGFWSGMFEWEVSLSLNVKRS